jgi:hypothetical protein
MGVRLVAANRGGTIPQHQSCVVVGQSEMHQLRQPPFLYTCMTVLRSFPAIR